jgi:CubicO group peptidase (beta-lactamase class C family)
MAFGFTGPAYSAGVPESVYPGDGWRHVEDLRSHGWSPAKLAEARRVAAAIGSAAVLVVNRGVVIAAWGDLTHKYSCHSMRKSLISALYGIAHARNQIDLGITLAQLEIDDHPPALTPEEKGATIEDLLTSRSGIYHPALSESPEMKARRPARHSHPPGTFWYYNNWDFNALGTIYEQATGNGVFDAFYEEIAVPTGMQDYGPADGRYVTGPASVHRTYQFRMSTRDLARFGLLYLRRGRWQERQLLSSQWVDASTRFHATVGFRRGYGYMWWILQTGSRLPNIRIPEAAYYAAGYRGHRLWKLLAAAGMVGIGPDPSWSAAAGVRLSGAAIRETLLHKAIEMGNSMRFTAYADGRCAIFRLGQVHERGRWWVEGDLFCSRWEGEAGGPVRRYRLAVEGTTIRRYEVDGTLAGEGELDSVLFHLPHVNHYLSPPGRRW